jgi:hypothetical protein
VGDEITQQTLLPEVRDPNLWIVKCRIGEEKVANNPALSAVLRIRIRDPVLI